MGQKLVELFNFAKSAGGSVAEMRLAMKVGIPASKAASTPDDPALLTKVKSAIKEITGKDAP